MANLVKFPVDHAHLEHPILCSHCQNMARVLVFQIGKAGERGNSPRKTRGRVPPPGMPWWWNNL
jgi:hypothetical protein